MKRLFIAINLPENIKKEIGAIINNLQAVEGLKNAENIRWTPPENWHLTINFLGYQPESVIDLILKSAQETARVFSKPKIEFEKLILAPPNKTPRPPKFFKEKLWRPKMIWLVTTKETSQILNQIKIDLENNLEKNSVKFQIENRGYNGHITLARFANQSRITSREFFADIQKELNNLNSEKIKNISFIPQSLDLMESHLSPVRDKSRCDNKSAALQISNGVKRNG